MTNEDALKKSIHDLESQLRDARIRIKDLNSECGVLQRLVIDITNLYPSMESDSDVERISNIISGCAQDKAQK